MTLLNLLGYVSDVAVLSTYWWMSHKHRPLPFHIANALGCLPLIAIEVVARTWQPLILSAAFGVLGAYGWYREATA